MFGTGKSKFNLDKVKTQAIKLGLAEVSTSDAELEQLCLNALVAQATNQEADDEDDDSFEDKPKSKGKKTVVKGGKKPVKTKNAPVETDDDEDDEDDEDEDDADGTPKTNGAPAWFKSFAKRFDKVESNVVALAKKAKPSTSDTKRGSQSSSQRTKADAPYYLQNPKNKHLLKAWLTEQNAVADDDDDE
jgi:hypothetical protein